VPRIEVSVPTGTGTGRRQTIFGHNAINGVNPSLVGDRRR
jgi:hypothetical protein